MIKLAAANVVATTTETGTTNPVVTTMDTILVDTVVINVSRGTLSLKVRRGSVASTGAFTDTASALTVNVDPKGNYRSNDGSLFGTFTGVATLITSLEAALDGAILQSGVVDGTIAGT